MSAINTCKTEKQISHIIKYEFDKVNSFNNNSLPDSDGTVFAEEILDLKSPIKQKNIYSSQLKN